MAEEAKLLGHTITSLDPNPNCSITKYSDCHISKDYNDKEVLQYLNDHCDVITYEFENVDLDVLQKYTNRIPQKLKALEISRNRMIEKNYAKALGIKTPNYNLVSKSKDIFTPSIIKTLTGGYDGKGQYLISNTTNISNVNKIGKIPYICEELVLFDYEISVIGTRDTKGTIVYFPIPVNTHKNGILHTSIIDGNISKSISDLAYKYTKLILEDLDYVGTLAVEFFVRGDEVLFNEFAPRPHNSGHYSQEGTTVSQFKNHILAITGENIIEPTLIKNTIMINVLGQNKNYYINAKELPNATLHDYYKSSTRTNRKIGHINCTYNTMEERNETMKTILKEL